MRVEARQRTVYTVQLGGRRRHFLSQGAAYYAIAKALLGEKYLGPLRLSGEHFEASASDPDPERTRMRAERAYEMFMNIHRDGDEFSSTKWQAYVRRVAKKLRALAERRATTDRRKGGGE